MNNTKFMQEQNALNDLKEEYEELHGKLPFFEYKSCKFAFTDDFVSWLALKCNKLERKIEDMEEVKGD